MGRRGGFGGGGMRGGGGLRGGGLGGGSRGGFGVRGGGGFGVSGGRGGSLGGGLGGGSLGGGRNVGGGLGGFGGAPRRGPGFGSGLGLGMGLGWGMGGFGRRRRGFGMGMGGMGMGGMGRRGGCGSGCGTMILIIVVLLIIMALINSSGQNAPRGNTAAPPTQQTTTVRTPLDAGEANPLGPIFTDNMSPRWIQTPTRLAPGLNNFFRETGVRPHLYLTDRIPGSEGLTDHALSNFLETQLPLYAEALYERLFTDEAHFLLVFFEYDWGDDFLWYMYGVPGHRARIIMDMEAMDILTGYMHHFYVQDNLSNEEMFSTVFDRTATRIMQQPTDNRIVWVTLILIGGLAAIIIVLFVWWGRRTAQKNLEAEQTERILNRQLDTFGTDDEATRRAKEYE